MPNDTLMHKPILPADIWNYIVGTYLPAYSRVGSHSFHKTCKALSQKGFPKIKRPSVKKVIDSCKSPEDALNILNDPGLCDQLSFSELLSVAGMHPSITEHLLQFSMSAKDLQSLGSKSVASASLILKHKHHRLNNNERASIVRHHYTLAKEFVNKLNDLELGQIFNSSQIDLKAIFRVVVEESRASSSFMMGLATQLHFDHDPELGSRLLADEKSPLNKEKNLLNFATTMNHIYGSVAFLTLMSKQGKGHELLDNPALSNRLGWNLPYLGRYDRSVARRIVNDENLKPYLGLRELLDEGVAPLLEFQISLLKDRKIVELKNVSNPSENAAKQIMAEDRLNYRLSGHSLYRVCRKYPELEMLVLKDKKYLNKIPTYLMRFQNELYKPDASLDHVFYFRPKHVEANDLYKMRKDALKIYATRCASVAMAVLKDPKLQARIFEECTGQISEHSIRVPSIIFSPYVCVNQLHLEIIKAQVARGVKFNEVESKLIKDMEYRVSIHNKIINMANKLREQARQQKDIAALLTTKIVELCRLPVQSRFDEFVKLAKEYLTRNMSMMESDQVEIDLNYLKQNSDVIQQMLESSDIDSCLNLLDRIKVKQKNRMSLPVLELPWEMKRSAVDETITQDSNKKSKRG